MIDYEKLDVAAPLGAFSTFDAEILLPLVQAIPDDGVYLEVGVDKGKSLWLARQVAGEKVQVYGVDKRVDPKVKGAIFTRGDSTEVSKKWRGQIDVLFIDGDHSYEGCKADIEAWVPSVKEGGSVLFHDCDESSPGVVQAVAEFVNSNKRLVKKWELFKRIDKNTSMSGILL